MLIEQPLLRGVYHPRKERKKINQSKEKKNQKQCKRKSLAFRVEDIVAIKIDKVDKTFPLHPNVLIGKILHVDYNYTKFVTSRGIFSNFISTNRLNKCKATIMFLITPKRSPFHHLANKACRCPVYKNKVSLGE